jgi:hypothetical protein
MSRAVIFALTVLFATRAASAAFAAEGSKGPCTIATKGDSDTAKACASGGRQAANKLMKKMVADARAKGQRQFSCEGCHKDLDNFALKDSAKADYDKLKAVVASK